MFRMMHLMLYDVTVNIEMIRSILYIADFRVHLTYIFILMAKL